MGKTVFVTGEVDTGRGIVILSSSEPPDVTPTEGGPPPKLFAVQAGDEIVWTFHVEKDLEGRRIQVRCVEFANSQHLPLFEGHADHVVAAESAGGTTARFRSGPVSVKAIDGEYRFAVELTGGGEPVTLKCLWVQQHGGMPISVNPPMGGGEKRGGP
jgi:hypothetical protein